MTAIIIIFGSLYIAIGAVLLVGVTLHDIKEAFWLRGFRKHPYARRYRKRPRIFLDNEVTAARFDELRRSYRKLNRTNTQAGYALRLSNAAQLPAGMLQNAVIRLNDQPGVRAYELPTVLVRTATIQGLLGNYRSIAADLFRKSRAGLSTPHLTGDAVLRKASAKPPKKDSIYAGCSGVIRLTLPFVLIITMYAGIVMNLSELLLIALGGFSLFMITAIWWHDQLGFKQKFTYALLLPITLWYFAGISIEQSLKILAHVSKAIFHSCVGLFVRIKDILRIIE